MAQEKKRRASKSGRQDQPVEGEAVEKKESADKEPVETETPREEAETRQNAETAVCPVVGVGASAGGLEALEGLLSHLPSEPPMALVVVQHRASDRTSVMKSLLEKHTTFNVVDIEDGMAVQPNTAYLAPADQDVSIREGILYLTAPQPHAGARLPVDFFFRALAHDQAERAVCIILSGTGSDGTLGAKEIKAAGGMVMAQKEDQAKYDSMPRSIIDTGMVDFILPVEKMGEQLAQYVRHPLLKAHQAPELEKNLEDQFQKIFLLIRRGTGHDFSHYKRSTIQRRIARRLAVHQIENVENYVKLLQENPNEVHTLAKEMLITVTSFFRDPEAFEALREHAIRRIVEQRSADMPIRIWVPACATGEEAYTIAILLHEEMDAAGQRYGNVQIFATDLDDESIEVARRGQYPKSIASDVSPARLKRYFTEENNHYKIKTGIRETLIFAKHNLIKDAPFTRLDLISCRNVLIYMDTTLQRKLIPMFHYTLNRSGFLFLGESESIGTFADLFASVDSRHKVFKRKLVETAYEPEAEISYPKRPEPVGEKGQGSISPRDLGKVAEKLILRDYSLPCVLVNEAHDVVFFSGDTTSYLSQPGGKPTFNILQMVRPEIHHRLSLLLQRAFQEKRLVAEKDVQLRIGDRYIDVDIVVRPVFDAGGVDNLAMIIFTGKPKEERELGQSKPVSLPEQQKDGRIRALEQELQSTKEYLQTTIEELETSNEELKSSNEELQSTNEELQSTNEELDTSREELQSSNEELRTVNSEYHQKIDELSKAYDDLNNLLAATEVATLFLDHDQRIRRFTPTARKLFRLMDRDVGRPLQDIASAIRYDSFLADIHSVTETLTRVDKEMQDKDGIWYQMKIVPYRTADNIIEGTVVTFIDISAQKENAALAETIVETVREPLLILDSNLHVVLANPAFYRHFQTAPRDTLSRLIYDLGDRQWNIPDLRRLLEQIIPKDTRFEDFAVTHDFPRLGRRTMLLNARQTTLRGEATRRILLAFKDVTDRTEGSVETEKKPGS